MAKPRKQWYLLAYDIRNPRRLQRTHAFVKKLGIPLQKSVFL
ncbi:MAG TPA: CRISPR-associated endonuclease Cas2, partial [Desulfobulbus sp.]|nr:CRISPR-associated endonuclease Cas2 [Desulfobulbus sp.]